MLSLRERQQQLGARVGAAFFGFDARLKVGASSDLGSGRVPLNGLRHPPTSTTSGWYLWTGTVLSDAPDFFEPLHGVHLAEVCPQILPYLALPPGWRFLLAPCQEDVWFDPSLLGTPG